MKKKLMVAAIVILLGAAALVLHHFLTAGETGWGQGYSGTVEAIEVLPSFQVPGKIAAVKFDEGQTVKAGQILAMIDSTELSNQTAAARAAVDLSRSRLEPLKKQAQYLEKSVEARILSARAALEKVMAGPRSQEIERTRQAVEQARAQALLAMEKAERARVLYAKEVLPLARMDEAVRASEGAEAALRQAEEALKIAEEGSRGEDIRMAEANLGAALAEREAAARARLEIGPAQKQVELALAEAALAETRLRYATLRAPIEGVVLSRNIEKGESVVPGNPVASLADLSTVQVRFFAEEPDLGRLSVGIQIFLRSDSFEGETFSGTLTFLSDRAEFTPKMVLTREERTRLVYMAKASFENPDLKLKPGMPVDIFLENHP